LALIKTGGDLGSPLARLVLLEAADADDRTLTPVAITAVVSHTAGAGTLNLAARAAKVP